jgi:DNA-binding beta-propeller fold protein YncE
MKYSMLAAASLATALALVPPALAEDSKPQPKPASKADAAKPPAVSPGYRLASRHAVGGEGGWDYLTVDAESRRIFVSRSSHVMVLDADSGKVVGDIPGTDGVHGIALAPDLGRGFTSDGRTGTIMIFDLATLKKTGAVKATGENPDAILYDAATKRVFSFNGRGKNATAIDAANGAVLGTVPLGGKPEFAAADGAGRVFVNVEDRNEVVAIDSRKLEVVARWSIAGCEEPASMAIDPKKARLFIGCHNKVLAVVGTSDGKVLAAVAIGQGNDAAAFEPATGLVFASNGDGTLTIVRESAPGVFAAVQTVTTKKGARTMALDPKSRRVFLPAAEYGPVPAATADNPRPRAPMIPGSFELLVVSPE